MYLEEPYRNRGLKEQILIYMMRDMLDHNATIIWEVCHEKCKQYHNLWDFSYVDNVDPSVTGGGYYMVIPKDPKKLMVQIQQAPPPARL